MTTDIERFRQIAQPPSWALKKIGGGRLSGMTDIKPAWRIQAMTEAYGLCGIGWKFGVIREWTEPGSEGQVFAFVDVALYIKIGKEWSEPIPGTGGSMLIEKERGGLHSNDEAFKMATTDALSSAMKMIGMAADVYAGQWTGSKYLNQAAPTPVATPGDKKAIATASAAIKNATTIEELNDIGNDLKSKPLAVRNAMSNPWKTRYRELAEKDKVNADS